MLALSAAGDRLVTANIADATISAIDPTGGAEPVVIRVGRQPEGIAITPDGREAWVGSNQDSMVVIVDLRRGTPVDTLHGFAFPYRIAISPDGNRAVITDPVSAQIRIVDARTRRMLATVAIARDSLVATAEVPGSPSPEGVALSRDSRRAYVTLQGRNRVAIVDLERGAIVGYGVTGTWSDGIGFSPVRVARQP
jgi:DNA-binding beta-propeller fold protein YncE